MAEPIERSRRVTPLLPCIGCAHAAVCAVKPVVEGLRFEMPVGPEIITINSRFTVACSERASAARKTAGGKIAAAWTPERRQDAADRMRVYNAARRADSL